MSGSISVLGGGVWVYKRTRRGVWVYKRTRRGV